MARTIKDIELTIITAVANEPLLAGLNSTSKVSIWRLMVFVFASAIWTLDELFDLHLAEVLKLLSELKPHRASWYKNKALAFQWGHPLVTDSDLYDNTGFTADQILESQIIKYCAVNESNGKLIIKVATELNGKLQPLSIQQRNAFAVYINEIKDAGVDITVINYLPDRLYLTIRIFFDPLVLDSNGFSILNGGKPVETVINQYMKELPFNGQLVLAHLVDKLQAVPGVSIPDLAHAESSWIDATSNDYGQIYPIDVKKIPESGYFEVVDFNSITYVANA